MNQENHNDCHDKSQDTRMDNTEFKDDLELKDYLSCLFVSKEFADVEITFTSAQVSESIWCHKLVLARSAVFRTMLNSSMAEGRTGKIELQDVSPNIFKLLLDFLYCDKIPEATQLNGDSLKLLQLADKYEIRSLLYRMLKEYSFNTGELLECCEFWLPKQQTSRNRDTISRLIKRFDLNEKFISSDSFGQCSEQLAILLLKEYIKQSSRKQADWNMKLGGRHNLSYSQQLTVSWIDKAISGIILWVKYHHQKAPTSEVYKHALQLTECIEESVKAYVTLEAIITRYLPLNVFNPEFLLEVISNKWTKEGHYSIKSCTFKEKPYW